MKKVIMSVVCIGMILTLVGWTQANLNPSDVEVYIDAPKQKKLSETILASGNLVFADEVQLSTEVTGVVEMVHVEEGQLVEQGQILISLDMLNYKADVDRAEASVRMQEIEIKRLQELYRELQSRLVRVEKIWKQRLVDESTYEQLVSENLLAKIKVESARAGLQQSQAILEQARERLDKTQFHAPISGLVASVDVKPGETVIVGTTNIAGTSLMTLADASSLIGSLRVDEADIASIYVGQSVQVFSAAEPKNPVQGKVTRIGSVAKRAGVGEGLYYPVEVGFENNKSFYAGMSCRAELMVTQSDPLLTVPISAINTVDGKSYVWTVNGQRAVKTPVDLGMASDTEQVVIAGLSDKDQVVIGPSRQLSFLAEGVSVKEIGQSL